MKEDKNVEEIWSSTMTNICIPSKYKSQQKHEDATKNLQYGLYAHSGTEPSSVTPSQKVVS